MSDKILREIEVMDVVKGVGSAVIDAVVSVNPVSCFYWSVMKSSKENSLQRRHEIWQHEVGERLSKLEKTVFESLGNNENFVTTLLRATELAIKTNGKKVEYLANAVKYSAENDINEDALIIMLNCIEKYTLSHIKVLKYLENPTLYSAGVDYTLGGAFTYFDNSFPDFNKQLRNIILKDLYHDGLTTIDTDATMSRNGMDAKKTTELGDLFITIFGIEDDGK